MVKRRMEIIAASQLSTWTDSDTAMQIVGTSLGVFGAGPLDPTAVLANETPLRNALFDVLLSLVEGGALEMRPADDGRYAFRWRADIAVAGLSTQGSTTIDLTAPPPSDPELARVRAERDEALGRADFAEALAAERERLLRLAGVQSPSEPPAARHRLPPDARDELLTLHSRDETVLDVLYAAAPKPAARKSAPRTPARTKMTAGKSAANAEPDRQESNDVVYLTPPDANEEPDIDLTEESGGTIYDAEDDDARAPRPKWSGYSIDKANTHLSAANGLGVVD